MIRGWSAKGQKVLCLDTAEKRGKSGTEKNYFPMPRSDRRSPDLVVRRWSVVGRRLKEYLRQLEDALLPRHAVRDARGVLELAQVRDIPVVVAHQCVLVRVLRRVAQHPLGLLDRDERVGGIRPISPLVDRRELECFENLERQDRGPGRQ